ncbi:MAG TPA: Flp pilus assembly protein CpaB [Rhodospirillaceae bacterium]|nr:Flp pilus assembly protein CpaB [Rhodospirillaceae bacterium]
MLLGHIEIMNKNILIVLGGGFLVAVIVAVIVQASFAKKNTNMIEVAVASKLVKVGETVTDSNFKWQEWPKESVFAGAVTREGKKKISEVVQGKIRRDMSAGEPLLKVSLATSGKGNILAAAMEPGMRAMAIKVSAESMVGGFISPGDKVDVILSYQVRLSGEEADSAAGKVDRHASQTILENVNVLAIDQNSNKEDDKAKVGRTVTLEVDTAGVEKLVLARDMGDLSLSLRALGDEGHKDKAHKEFTTDVQVSKLLQELGKIKKNSGGKSDIVRVYNGQDIENITVRR